MTTHLLLALLIVVPLAAAVIALLLRRAPAVQPWVNLVSMISMAGLSVALLVRVSSAGIQATTFGGWPMPFGITLVADHLSVIMLLISSIMGVVLAIYAMGDMDPKRVKFGFYPFMNLLMVGIAGAFLTGDLFNLYVWFEVLLIASFVLMALGNTRAQLTANIKYVSINLVSSLIFLAGIGFIYGLTGSLNMAEVASILGDMEGASGIITTVSMLFLIAFGIKAAIFPLFYWLPASYHTPPPTIMALFAGLLTKVGVYAMIRVFTLLFNVQDGYTQTILLWIAGLTMVTGVLGAAAQTDFRRILSFHIVSQIGYMIMGLALFTPLALIGSIYYVVHNILAKSNLFLISGVTRHLQGTFTLKKLKGLYAHYPGLSILFLLSAFALAGFPPLSGFWGKLILGIAGLQAQEYIIVGVAFAVGIMTMFSMTKIWMYSFLPGGGADDDQPADQPDTVPPLAGNVRLLYVPIALVAVLIVGISLFIGPVYEVGNQAATELMNADLYIDAVLGHEDSIAQPAPGADLDGSAGGVHTR